MRAPQPIEDEHTMKSHPMKTNDLQQALALYIARRPCDAGRLVHLASFAHSAPGAFAAASEHDLLEAFDTFVRDGWLTDEAPGYRITAKGQRLASAGRLPG